MDKYLPWYAIDGTLSRTGSRIFATEYGWKQYFLLELTFLTNVIGVTITSREHDTGNVTRESQNTDSEHVTQEFGTQSINGVTIRAGTTKMIGMCAVMNVNGVVGNICDEWKDLGYCGELQLEDNILPLREYTVMCPSRILARLVVVQQYDSSVKRSLTFEEISVLSLIHI